MSSTALGIVTSRKLSLRVRFLQQCLSFINYIETEIRYAHRVLSEIVQDYHNGMEFQAFLSAVCKTLEQKTPFPEAWSNTLKSVSSTYGLLRQDIELICNFGNELGSSDINGQIALCQLHKKLLTATLETALDEKNKKSKLYLMLGSSFGICFAILLL